VASDFGPEQKVGASPIGLEVQAEHLNIERPWKWGGHGRHGSGGNKTHDLKAPLTEMDHKVLT
jgi:hypothetical protein